VTRWHASEPEEGTRSIAELDLRSEPPAAWMDAIASAQARLPCGGVLKAVLDADPQPLRSALSRRGLVRSMEEPRGVWTLELCAPGSAAALDLLDLEAPEPLQRILEASAALAPGARLLARVPRFPRMLLPRLAERGLGWEVYEERDGTALVCVRRPS
jgi:uncharacterized protein (DUF2249 family)